MPIAQRHCALRYVTRNALLPRTVNRTRHDTTEPMPRPPCTALTNTQWMEDDKPIADTARTLAERGRLGEMPCAISPPLR